MNQFSSRFQFEIGLPTSPPILWKHYEVELMQSWNFSVILIFVIVAHTIISLAADTNASLLFYSDLRSGQVAMFSYSGTEEKVVLKQNNTWSMVTDTNNRY